MQKIPYPLLNLFTWLMSFFMYTLNWDMSVGRHAAGCVRLGVSHQRGLAGLDTAYVPLVPYTRVPIFIAPGAVKDMPVVEDGKVVPGKVMNINASFDHRYIDGFHAGILSNTLREMLENPFEQFDKLDRWFPPSPRPSPSRPWGRATPADAFPRANARSGQKTFPAALTCRRLQVMWVDVVSQDLSCRRLQVKPPRRVFPPQAQASRQEREPGAGATIWRRRRTRSAMGGCVENRPMMAPPDSGLTMKRCEVAGAWS